MLGFSEISFNSKRVMFKPNFSRRHTDWYVQLSQTFKLLLIHPTTKFKYVYEPSEPWLSLGILENYKPQCVSDEDMRNDVPLADLLKVLNKPLLSGSPYQTIGYESPVASEYEDSTSTSL